MDVILGMLLVLLGFFIGYGIRSLAAKREIFALRKKFREEKEILQIQLKVAMKDHC